VGGLIKHFIDFQRLEMTWEAGMQYS